MSELRKVKRAAAKAAVARAALEDAIRELHAQGVSLRDLGRVAGMSHEQVRRIVSRGDHGGQ